MIRKVVSDLEAIYKIIESKPFQKALGESESSDIIRQVLNVGIEAYAKTLMGDTRGEQQVINSPVAAPLLTVSRQSDKELFSRFATVADDEVDYSV